LETFLRCFVHACPATWRNWLALAEFWYNTSVHSATAKTTFSVLYGHEPHHFGISVEDVYVPVVLSEWMQERQVMLDLVRQHLLRAKDKMKRQADKKRSERSF
jgi:hypothetical protein